MTAALRPWLDSRASWWIYGMVVGWLVAMFTCQLAYHVVMSEDAAPVQPVAERPVLPVS